MNKEFGCQDMTKPIKRILIKHPNSAYKTQANIDEQAKNLNYFGTPNFEQSINDYNKFLNILSFDIEIHTLPADNKTSLDSIYTHDPFNFKYGEYFVQRENSYVKVSLK